jgi:TonB family protein
MRKCALVFVAILVCASAAARGPRPDAAVPTQLEIGRHTFFDFGPPTDYYEVLVVSQTENGSSIERMTLTPGYACTPAKVEIASALISESVADLLGKTNPCAIPEKELRRELKRCKKCLVFSGANVAMEVECGAQTRIIRADILDRDMFDPAPNTPQHTSWTMQLLEKLDKAVGPGVMEKPIFPVAQEDVSAKVDYGAQNIVDIASGKYDQLFQGAPDKLSDLYRAALAYPPQPSIHLVSSAPIAPMEFISPVYPPLAKLARVEGQVGLKLTVDQLGSPSKIMFASGNPLLRGATEDAVKRWKFPVEAANQQVEVTIEFKTNCSNK